MTIDVFAQHFADVKDPRQTAKISYPPLQRIVLIYLRHYHRL
jgi:hypothetical protein